MPQLWNVADVLRFQNPSLYCSKNVYGKKYQPYTIDQFHRITTIFEKSLEEKKICLAMFLVLHRHSTKLGLGTCITNSNCSFLANIKNLRILCAWAILQDQMITCTQVTCLTFTKKHVATFGDDTKILAYGCNNIQSATKLLNLLMWWNAGLGNGVSNYINAHRFQKWTY